MLPVQLLVAKLNCDASSKSFKCLLSDFLRDDIYYILKAWPISELQLDIVESLPRELFHPLIV